LIVDEDGLRIVSKGAAYVFAGSIANKLLAYIYLLILARFLGPIWLGTYVLLITIVESTSVICRIGLPTSLSRFIAIYQSNKEYSRIKGLLRFAFLLPVAVSIFIASIIFIFSDYICIHIFRNGALLLYLRTIILFLPLTTAVNIFKPVFQGLKDMKNMVLIDLTESTSLIPVFLILVFLFPDKIWACLWAYVSSQIISIIFSHFRLRKKAAFTQNRDIKPDLNVRELLSYSLPLLFVAVSNQIFLNVDRLMIGYFCTVKDVGLYTPAASVAIFVSAPLTMFNPIFSPIIARYYHEQRIGELSYLFKTITRWAFTVSLPLFIFILLMSKEIMQIFGKQYLQSSGVLVILSLAQLINAATGSVSIILAMSSNQKILLVVTVFVNILNIILNMFLIPCLGIMGAAVATGISIIMLNVLNCYFVFRVVSVHPFDMKFLRPLLKGIVTFGALFLMTCVTQQFDYKVRLTASLCLFFLVSVGLTFIFKLEKDELFIFKLLEEKIK